MAVEFTTRNQSHFGPRAVYDPAVAAAGPWHRLSGLMGSRYGTVQIRVDQEAIARITKEVATIPGAMRKIIPAALNAAASEARTYLGREFRARMNVRRRKSIDDRLHKGDPATENRWHTDIWFDLTRFTIASFRDVQQTPAGVTWSTGGTSESLRGGFIPRAFIRKGLTHYQTGEYMELRQVWRRAGPPGMSARLVPRKPLFVMRGPSLAYVFAEDPAFQDAAGEQGGRILEKKVSQQVNRFLTT